MNMDSARTNRPEGDPRDHSHGPGLSAGAEADRVAVTGVMAYARRAAASAARASLPVLVAGAVVATLGTPQGVSLAQSEGGILFSDAGGGGADLYVVDETGAGRRAVTTTSDLAEAQGDWSPDHASAAFTAFGGGLWRLGVLDVATGTARTVTSGPEDFEPDWSPDGARLLFTSYFNRDSLDQSSFIMTAASDGSATRPVIELRHRTHYLGNPRWSPEGARVAFTVGSSSEGGTLYVMAADGTGARPLLEHSGWDDIDPAWSPDGSRIAFASGRNQGSTAATRHDIWLLDLAENVAGTVIVDDDRDLRRPAWSPDGLKLAFDARMEGGGAASYSIHVAPALGGPVGTPIAVGREPDWGGVPLPTATPVALTATPTVASTGTSEASATPPDLTEIPPVPTLPVFPTFPPTAATATGPAPTFPPPTEPANPSPTSTELAGPTSTATPGSSFWRILLPIAYRGGIALAGEASLSAGTSARR